MMNNSYKDIKYLFVDIDGVMTTGRKVYDDAHAVVYKEYNDKDFTALSLFKQKGVRVVLLSGDKKINQAMADKRKLEAYFTSWLLVGQEPELPEKVQIMKDLGADLSQSAYVGDDYFDIAVFKHVAYSFCPADAPGYVKRNCQHTLAIKGGEGVIAALFDLIYGQEF
jgi:3-deoxy-D-manno-octulosonate 8-phosphate phosphatase (KDO 8-P phosphatase)